LHLCYVACAAILGLLEILDRLHRKERHSGEGYRVIDDNIYSPTFYATITRTGYLNATALSTEALRQRGLSFFWRKTQEREIYARLDTLLPREIVKWTLSFHLTIFFTHYRAAGSANRRLARFGRFTLRLLNLFRPIRP